MVSRRSRGSVFRISPNIPETLAARRRRVLRRQVLRRQRPARRTADHFARRRETGAVAGAVPDSFFAVPFDFASHVSADAAQRMERSFLVAIEGDVPVGHDLALTPGQILMALGHREPPFPWLLSLPPRRDELLRHKDQQAEVAGDRELHVAQALGFCPLSLRGPEAAAVHGAAAGEVDRERPDEDEEQQSEDPRRRAPPETE